VADWQPPSGRRLTSEDLHAAAERLRKISALTEGLPGDSPNDARLRDRLELAAVVKDRHSRGRGHRRRSRLGHELCRVAGRRPWSDVVSFGVDRARAQRCRPDARLHRGGAPALRLKRKPFVIKLKGQGGNPVDEEQAVGREQYAGSGGQLNR
jgi:hypothetical protein